MIQVREVGRPRVVEARSNVRLLGQFAPCGMSMSQLQELLEARAGAGTRGAIVDHLSDYGSRARRLVMTRARAVVGLHQSWVVGAVVRRWHAHAAF